MVDVKRILIYVLLFMNPTGKNIASDKSWKGRKSPWLGTKNIWGLFYKVGLLYEDVIIK